MSTIQIEQQTSADNLLKAAGRLSQPEFEKFVYRIIKLRARRQVKCLSYPEDELMLKINQGLEPGIQSRYDELIAKRRSESPLTKEEYRELLRLTDLSEELEARRVGYLAELARHRKMSITDLMENLGIQSPTSLSHNRANFHGKSNRGGITLQQARAGQFA